MESPLTEVIPVGMDIGGVGWGASGGIWGIGGYGVGSGDLVFVFCVSRKTKKRESVREFPGLCDTGGFVLVFATRKFPGPCPGIPGGILRTYLIFLSP